RRINDPVYLASGTNDITEVQEVVADKSAKVVAKSVAKIESELRSDCKVLMEVSSDICGLGKIASWEGLQGAEVIRYQLSIDSDDFLVAAERDLGGRIECPGTPVSGESKPDLATLEIIPGGKAVDRAKNVRWGRRSLHTAGDEAQSLVELDISKAGQKIERPARPSLQAQGQVRFRALQEASNRDSRQSREGTRACQQSDVL